jgi:hypothetical protein
MGKGRWAKVLRFLVCFAVVFFLLCCIAQNVR